MTNCLIAGVGGQGTVLASKLIAAAAMKRGLEVRTTETIGMAQRGGSVVSHIRMGSEIYSPQIPLGKADVIIAFEPAEGARLIPYLAPDGTMIVCDGAVQPVTSSLSGAGYDARAILGYLKNQVPDTAVISAQAISRQCGSKMLNVALIGAALCCGRFPFDPVDMEAVIREKLSPRFVKPNLEALCLGQNICGKGGKQ